MTKFLSRFLAGLPLLAVCFPSWHANAAPGQQGDKASRPNIIFILSDDLAQGDVGCYGQKIIQTPRMDQMAAEGTRYTQAYCGTSVCAPSRASLLTGLRNAGLARWPGMIPAGKVRDEPWAFWDFLPTVAELGGVSLPKGFACDGISLVSFLKGGPAPKRDYFYWELFEGPFRQAIRFDDFKAVRNKAGGELEVYDLNADSGERNNIASTRPRLGFKSRSVDETSPGGRFELANNDARKTLPSR